MQLRSSTLESDQGTDQAPIQVVEWRRPALEHGFRIRDCEVRPLDNTIVRPDGADHVEPKVMDVLVFLAEHRGRIVTRQQLLDALWNQQPECDEALTRAVCTLRKHLGDDCHRPRFVATVYKRGYRLIPRVKPLTEPTLNGSNRDRSSADAVDRLLLTADVPPARPTVLEELRRRKVFRVASSYAVVGWLLLQIGEVTFEPIGIPPWGMTLLVFIIVLGFPLAVALAWALQMTSEGLVLEMPIRLSDPKRSQLARRGLQYVMITALVVVILALGYRLISLEIAQDFGAETSVTLFTQAGLLSSPQAAEQIGLAPRSR